LLPILTVVVAFAAITTQVDYKDTLTNRQARALSWVDHDLPPAAAFDIVYLGIPDGTLPCASAAAAEQQDLTTWTEYFNDRIGSVTHVYEANPRDYLAARQLTVAPGGAVLEDGKPFASRYLVIDSRQPVMGTRLARFDLSRIESQYRNGASLTLWRVDPPLRFDPLPQPTPPRGDGQPC